MDESPERSTVEIQGWIDRLLSGDESARGPLLESASRRLAVIARRMLVQFPRVGRWEEPEDILQFVLLRLHNALASIVPPTPRDFFRLSAAVTRRELLTLTRHYLGPLGQGANHSTVGGFADQGDSKGWSGPDDRTNDPRQLELWSEFHARVEALPDVEREVFDLLWYQELSQVDAARVVGVDVRTISRRWSSARRHLHDEMGGRLPS